MERRVVAIGLALLLHSAAPVAHADYQRAFTAYQAGRFDEARREFLVLASLGDAASQLNLAAMATRGEGMRVDRGEGVGWAMAAAQNGSTRIDGDAARRMFDALSPDQQQAARRVVEGYGRDAIVRRVVPAHDAGCSADPIEPTRVLERVETPVPPETRAGTASGFVIADFTVDVHGRARDVELVESSARHFDAPTLQVVLGSKYAPARRAGEPVETRRRVLLRWLREGQAERWDEPWFTELRELSELGAPSGQYLLGLMATADETTGMTKDAGRRLVFQAAQGGQPQAQIEMARRLLDAREACREPDKARTWLEAAATEGSRRAAVRLVGLLATPAADAEAVDSARRWLGAAAESDEEHVLKHALAWLAGVRPSPLADPARAADVADRLGAIERGVDPETDVLRGAAYAAAGRSKDADERRRSALRRAKRLGWPEDVVASLLARYGGPVAP